MEKLEDRLLIVLQERCGGQGRCLPDLASLVWAMEACWPSDPRPKVGEVAQAMKGLRRAGRIIVRLDNAGDKVCVLVNQGDGAIVPDGKAYHGE